MKTVLVSLLLVIYLTTVLSEEEKAAVDAPDAEAAPDTEAATNVYVFAHLRFKI